jgi:NitT/TauT family transport system substrate-binding protein
MRKMKSGLILVILVIFLTGCGQVAAPETASAPVADDTSVLRVGLMPDDGILPYLYGSQQGYFTEAGLNVEFQIFMSALDRDAALQAGELDAIYSDVISLVYYAEAGTPLKAVSSTQATYGIAVNEGDSLQGKSVGLSTNTLMEYLVDFALTDEGLTEEDIEKVAIPSLPNRLESYRAGQIQAIALPEPMLSMAVLKTGAVIETADSIGLDPGVLLVKADWLEAAPGAMSQFFAGYDRAAQGLNAGANQEDLLAIYAEAKFPEPIQDSFILPDYHMSQSPEEAQIQKAIDWLQNRDLIEGNHTYSTLVEAVALP